MMNIFFEILCSLTVAGSIVSVCILALRLIPVSVFPTKWLYRLGKLAILFYLFPVSLGLSWLLDIAFQTTSTITGTENAATSGVLAGTFIPEQTISVTTAWFLLCVWGIGVIGFSAWQAYCYQRFLNELSRTRTPVLCHSEAAIQLPLIKEALGLKRNITLAHSTLVRSPILVGLFKPTIYLPPENTVKMDIKMVIHHELVHLKHQDLWVKAVTLGVSALHWFNPLIHMIRRDIHTWSELACDEDVVKEMSHEERRRYGETILNVMAGTKKMPAQFCSSLSGEGKQLKRRLMIMFNVKKLKKKHWVISMGALLLITGVSTSTAVWASNHAVKVEAKATEAVPVPSVSETPKIVASPDKVGISESVTAPAASETPEIVAIPEDEVSEAVPVPSATVPSTTKPSEAKVVETATVPFTSKSPEIVAVPSEAQVTEAVPAPSEK
ncbi:M56 family metallopeptidase [Paenibacillus sp. 1781tsa1]|uniref:M56 family metallopeptidase n=1 Tax=Paenibacillus sp. 1781tsa1 TaxID=2953810 RepID=UPI0020A16EF2|nr:M56 family metallopeptidase [Paenibacillus sp. 1781tsa1]MCP1183067.1 peptidase M56 [Paenibacillus sp. 1781tsa1]